MLRLETPLLDLLNVSVDGIPDNFAVRLRPGASACIVAASGGLPRPVCERQTDLRLGDVPETTVVFHAGTASRGGETVTAGGRVLAITAGSERGLGDALDRCYAAIDRIAFEGMQFRRDIGWRAMREKK